jgi:hypothetical protein
MNASGFQELLEGLPDRELLRYARDYTRRCIAESDDPTAEAHWMLDLIFGECILRGKEWLYDKAREQVLRDSGATGSEHHPVRRRRRSAEWTAEETAHGEEVHDLYLELE